MFLCIAPAVLFTLDNDDKYAVKDGLAVLDEHIYGEQIQKQEVDNSSEPYSLIQNSTNMSKKTSNTYMKASTDSVEVRQMSINIPSFSFEINKAISAAENMELQDESNIEAIYGMLSVKFFGIGMYTCSMICTWPYQVPNISYACKALQFLWMMHRYVNS